MRIKDKAISIRAQLVASWGKVIYLFVSSIAFLTLVARSDNWRITPPGWLDPWIYINYWVTSTSPENFGWNDYYKSSRIPWILVGKFWTSIVGLNGFQTLIPIIVAFLTGIITWQITRTFHIAARLVAVQLIVFFPYMLPTNTGGTFYQNSLSGTVQLYCLLIFSQILGAENGKTRFQNLKTKKLYLLGMGLCLMFATNQMQVLVFLPLLSYFCFAVLQASNIHRLKFICSRMFFGFMCASGVIAVISSLLGFRFFYQYTFLKTIVSYSQPENSHQVWWYPLSTGWLNSALYLSLPASLIVLSLPTLQSILVLKRKSQVRSEDSLAFFLVMNSVFSTLLWIVLYIGKFHLLNWSYHAFPLTIFAIVGLSGFVQIVLPGRAQEFYSSNKIYAFSSFVPVLWVTQLFWAPTNLVQVLPNFFMITLALVFVWSLLLLTSERYLWKSIVMVAVSLLLTNMLFSQEFQKYREDNCHLGRENAKILFELADSALKLDYAPVSQVKIEYGEFEFAPKCFLSMDDLSMASAQIGPIRGAPIPKDTISAMQQESLGRYLIAWNVPSNYSDLIDIFDYKVVARSNHSSIKNYTAWEIWRISQ